MRLSQLLTTVVVAGATVAGTAAPAAAVPVCRVVTVGDGSLVHVEVCVDAAVNRSGTTVDPVITVTCVLPDLITAVSCGNEPLAVGKTGFEESKFELPDVDATTGSVRVNGGSVGTVWIGGRPYDVPITGFCVGDPAFCS